MKISTNIIKAMAITDMVNCINNFKSSEQLEQMSKEEQDKYWEYINKMQNKFLKDL